MIIKKIKKKIIDKKDRLYPNEFTREQYEKLVANFPIIPKETNYDKKN